MKAIRIRRKREKKKKRKETYQHIEEAKMESISWRLTEPWTLRAWHRTKQRRPSTTYTSASSYPDYQGTVVTPFLEGEGWVARRAV